MELVVLVEDIKQVFINKPLMTDEVLIAINRVIQRINMVYKGTETLKTLTGFDDTDNSLPIVDDITKLQYIYIDDNKYTNVDRTTFLDADSSDYIYNVIGNTIYFLSDLSSSTIKAVVFEVLPLLSTGTGFGTKSDSSTEQTIEIPTVAYEVLFTGAVYALVSKPAYYDKLTFENYRLSYNIAFRDFEDVSNSREPHKTVTPEYSW